MKILYVITQSDSIGGASLHVLDLAAGAQAAGQEVLLLAGGTGKLATLAKQRSIPYQALQHMVREISPWQDICAVNELSRHIRDFSPDIIHLHSSKAGIIGRISARITKTPCIFTAHGWAFTEGVSKNKRKVYQHIEKMCAFLAQRIITVSEYDRQLALKMRVAPPGKLVTIHNGVHDSHLRHSGPSRPEQGQLNVTMVARFSPPKDQASVVRALASSDIPNWRLELIGGGPLLEDTRHLAQTLNVAHQVDFPGECDDIPERLARADIFVLSSAWEGLPLSIIEAMRAGIPVVASDVGGVKELVFPGTTGMLIGRNDVEGLRDALEYLAQNPELRQAYGNAGRTKYEQQFSFSLMLSRTLDLYVQVINSNGK